MNEQHKRALDKALIWIRDNFKPIVIIVTGSIVRENPNFNSDLDIYVIHEDNFRQRIQKYFNSIPCEIFVNNIKHINKYLEEEYEDNRPITAHMISTGKVLIGNDNKEFKKLMQSANEFLLKSPGLSDKKKIYRKYMISSLFEDATDVKDTDVLTGTYFLNKMVSDIIDYIFISNSIPLPRSKERIKYLEMNFPDIWKLISSYYTSEDFFNKYDIAKILVGKIAGEYGFFEWASGQE
ncbi:MAG: nucleotidyltransferase domain-containing protein [Bacteroidota bacterium]|nr:nucleotidyltransferase domain-containing protein [Bacteroidota bacterium]